MVVVCNPTDISTDVPVESVRVRHLPSESYLHTLNSLLHKVNLVKSLPLYLRIFPLRTPDSENVRTLCRKRPRTSGQKRGVGSLNDEKYCRGHKCRRMHMDDDSSKHY